MKRLFFICVAFVNVCYGGNEVDVRQAVDDINAIYDDYLQGKNYIKLKSSTELDESNETYLISEYWSEGNNTRVKTPLYSLIIDSKNSVMVLPNEGKVIIEPVSNTRQGSFQKLNADSLLSHGVLHVEDHPGHERILHIQYEDAYGKKLGIKQCSIVYDRKQRLIKKVSYLSLQKGQWAWRHDETLERSTTYQDSFLPKNAVKTVISQGKLADQYKHYQLIDLRK